jgi:hypothetical protein
MLRAEWRSAVGLILVVAVVGGMVLTLAAGALRTQSAPDRFEEAYGNRYDTGLEQGSGPPLTEEIDALPAVDDVKAATFFFGGVVPEGADEPVEGITFAGDPEALSTELIDGRLFDEGELGEFVATTNWVDEAGAEIGDHFTLLTISAASANQGGFDAEPDGPTFDATLVGVVRGGPDSDEFPLALFPTGLLDGDIGVSASEMLVSLRDGSDVGDLRDQLDTLGGDVELTLNPIEAVAKDTREAVGTQAAGLFVVFAIAAVAGLLVVGQLAVRRSRASDDQRLSLQAVGFTRGQRLADAVARIGIPGLVGAVLAGVAAYLVSDLFPRGFTRRVEPEPGLRVEPLAHLVGPVLLAGGLVVTVAVFLVVGARTRRPRLSPIDRLSAQLGQAKAAMGLRFAFARHARDAGSLSTPLLGLAVLVATLAAAVTFGRSFDALLDDPARWGVTYDLGSGQGGFEAVPEDVQATVRSDPDVESVTLLSSGSANIGEGSLDLTAFDGDIDVVALEGAVPATADEIALGAIEADDLDVGVGDELTLEGAAGSHTYTVTGLVVVPGVGGTEGLGSSGLVTFDGLRALDDEAALNAMAITVRDGASVEAVRERLSEQTQLAIGRFDPPTVITNYQRVRTAPWVVAALLGLLVLLSITNLVIVTLNRRGRDIAVIKALGADRRWVSRVEHWHALAVGLAVGVLAAVIGVAAGRVVFRWRVTERVGSTDETVVPLVAMGLGILALVVVTDAVAQVAVRWRRGSVARRLATE